MTTPTQRRPARAGAGSLATIAAVGALIGGLTGCAGPADAAGGDGDAVLIVRDGALRAPDSDCSGSARYLFVHSGAVLTISEGEDVVTELTLQPGTAQRADDKDYGTVARVPTFCEFSFSAAELTAGTTYTFRIGDRSLGEAEYQRDDSGPFRLGYPALGDPSSVQEGE
ncbi:hypothetical protein ACFVAE_10900 [Microbacterium sp. NPDC057659]|uniref:hypothetical protein n=1 Tax=Microbacterium sp. NPDC057659 TaxID=3346198 RepID=UPI00366D1F64